MYPHVDSFGCDYHGCCIAFLFLQKQTLNTSSYKMCALLSALQGGGWCSTIKASMTESEMEIFFVQFGEGRKPVLFLWGKDKVGNSD